MKTVLLIGKNGQVGWELQRTLLSLGNVIALDRTQLDLTQPDAIRRTIRDAAPDIIVNAAGYTAVDKAESEPELVMRVNAVAPGIIAEEAKRINALLIHYSTDYVFDGKNSILYVEDDEPNPVNAYGRSKLAGERAIVAAGCAHLILRTSWIYSGRGTNFVLTMLRLAREKKELTIVDDQIGSPTWARELANSTVELAKSTSLGNRSGVYHLSASGYASRLDFANAILRYAKETSAIKLGWAELQPITTANFPLPAARPLNAATSKEKIKNLFGLDMSPWEIQLQQFIIELMADTAWRQRVGF